MRRLPAEVADGVARVANHPVMAAPSATPAGKRIEVGVRPEFVGFGADGLPARVVRVADIGRNRVVETRVGDTRVLALVAEDAEIPEGETHLVFDPERTALYADGWRVGERSGAR